MKIKKLLFVMFVLSIVSMANAATYTWTASVAGDSNWSNTSNWTASYPTSGDTAQINYLSAGQPVINSAVESGNVRIGCTAATGVASLTINSGGTLSTPTNIASSRSINVGYVSGAEGLLTLNDGGTINSKAINVGVSAVGTFDMLGGTVNVTTTAACATQIQIGCLSGHGVAKFNMYGGTINMIYNSAETADKVLSVGYYGSTSAAEALSQFNMSGGTINMNDGLSTSQGQVIAVAYGAGTDNSEFNLSGGTINLKTSTTGGEELFAVGYGTSSSGVLNMTGGTINIDGTSTAAAFSVGYASGSTGIANISGGTLNTRFITLGRIGSGTINLSDDGAINLTSGMRIGESASRTGNGILNMTGGSIENGYIAIGYATASALTTPDQFNISGGTVDVDKILVGRAGNGNLTITGSDAEISTNYLFVGCDGETSYSTGTITFNVGANGVTAIQADSVMLGVDNVSSIANLIVTLTAAPLTGDILLIDNQGTAAVSGLFDSVNSGSAAEGAAVMLSFGGIDYTYTLTYVGGTGNDVVLTIPEPATLIILGFGLIGVLRTRKH